MMGEEIEQLKSVFRSLVVSSPTQVDVRSLLRDYRSMIGAPVPLARFGHRNPVDFLKERFGNCFQFSGPPSNPVLTLIVPESLKHIDKFVQKQKVPSTRKFNPKRRSIPETVVHPPHNNARHQPVLRTTQAVNRIQEPNKSDLNAFNKPSVNTNKPNGATNSEIPHTNKIEENNNWVPTKPDEEVTHSSEAVHQFLKKRLPVYNCLQELELHETLDKCTLDSQDNDSGRHSGSSGSGPKTHQLEQLKSEILTLIADVPDGVWCTDLIRLYRERYHRELNFRRFGYTSVLSLAYSAGLQATRPEAAGEWLLRAAPPAEAPRPAPLARRRAPAPAPAAGDSDEALPGIDFDPDVFPEDCMHYMESIEPISLDDFRPGAMVEVMIGEVYSPSHFWFFRLGENYNIAMEDMMDEMMVYYNGEGRDRVLARGAVRVGHYCASLYESDWHRSLIVKIVDSDTVKVRHVDYGTVDTLSAAALRPLLRRWGALPAQAARARLAGVRPPGAGARWPHAAAAAFLAAVAERRLVANVVALDARERVAELLLIDTAGARDRCMGAELLRAGHADARADSALRTLDAHLYPRFEALESGNTPNFAEIRAYLRDGIALDYVRAYRDHVPPAFVPPHESPPPPSAFVPLHESQPPPSAFVPLHESPPPPSVFVPLHESPPLPYAFVPPHESPPPPPASVPPHESSPASLLSPLAPAYEPLQPGLAPAATAPRPPESPPCPSPAPAVPPPASSPIASAPSPSPASSVPSTDPVTSPSEPVVKEPAPPVAGVTLSVEECETYRVLSHVNPAAAHWFIVGVMGRAAPGPRVPPPLLFAPPPLYAPPTRMFAPAPLPYPPASLPLRFPPQPLPRGCRPPPGFNF